MIYHKIFEFYFNNDINKYKVKWYYDLKNYDSTTLMDIRQDIIIIESEILELAEKKWTREDIGIRELMKLDRLKIKAMQRGDKVGKDNQ